MVRVKPRFISPCFKNQEKLEQVCSSLNKKLRKSQSRLEFIRLEVKLMIDLDVDEDSYIFVYLTDMSSPVLKACALGDRLKLTLMSPVALLFGGKVT